MYWLPPTLVKQSGAATMTGGHSPGEDEPIEAAAEILAERIGVEEHRAGAGEADHREERRLATRGIVAGRKVDVEIALGGIAHRVPARGSRSRAGAPRSCPAAPFGHGSERYHRPSRRWIRGRESRRRWAVVRTHRGYGSEARDPARRSGRRARGVRAGASARRRGSPMRSASGSSRSAHRGARAR